MLWLCLAWLSLSSAQPDVGWPLPAVPQRWRRCGRTRRTCARTRRWGRGWGSAPPARPGGASPCLPSSARRPLLLPDGKREGARAPEGGGLASGAVEALRLLRGPAGRCGARRRSGRAAAAGARPYGGCRAPWWPLTRVRAGRSYTHAPAGTQPTTPHRPDNPTRASSRTPVSLLLTSPATTPPVQLPSQSCRFLPRPAPRPSGSQHMHALPGRPGGGRSAAGRTGSRDGRRSGGSEANLDTHTHIHTHIHMCMHATWRTR